MSVVASLVGTLTFASAPASADIGFDASDTYRVPIGDAPAIGPADASVTIVEFSDFFCPACNRVAVTLADLMRLYPGSIRLVYRHNLLDPEDGTLGAQAAMAAHEQGKFWPMHDMLFSSPQPINRGTVEEYAEQLGLDMARFRAALDTGKHMAKIRADIEVARKLGISATPMIFVNGRAITGAQPLGVFVQLVEEELERADTMITGGVDPGELYEALTSSGERKAHAIATGADDRETPELDQAASYRVGLGLESHRRGSSDALVTLVEFSDFDCSYCRATRATLEQLAKEQGSDLRIVYRHKPLIAIGNTKLAAEAAVAAGAQGKFWKFHDQAFAHDAPLRRADLEEIGREIGLDMDAYRRALDERKYLPQVIADAADAASLGVKGTPTFFINGTPLIGAVPIARFRELIAEKRKQAEKIVASGVAREDLYDEIGRRAELAAAAAKLPSKGKQKKADPVDYHIEVLIACRKRDAAAAKKAFAKVKDKRRRQFLRKDCKRLGVDL